MGTAVPLPVPPELQRGAHHSREDWIESARFSIDLLCRALGRGDLGEIDLLDVGCGTKLVKAFLDESLPIGSYTGVDVSADVIRWLEAHVADSRFEFHHLDAHNAMYRPEGAPLESFERLPMGARRFDAICLFSVFTHLVPRDFGAMIRLLRGHAKPGATLFFSLFIEDPDEGKDLANAITAQLESSDPEVRERATAALERRMFDFGSRDDDRFDDEDPDHPLEVARYEEDYALELVRAGGWEVVELRPPVPPFIQHHMICRPVDEAAFE